LEWFWRSSGHLFFPSCHDSSLPFSLLPLAWFLSLPLSLRSSDSVRLPAAIVALVVLKLFHSHPNRTHAMLSLLCVVSPHSHAEWPPPKTTAACHGRLLFKRSKAHRAQKPKPLGEGTRIMDARRTFMQKFLEDFHISQSRFCRNKLYKYIRKVITHKYNHQHCK